MWRWRWLAVVVARAAAESEPIHVMLAGDAAVLPGLAVRLLFCRPPAGPFSTHAQKRSPYDWLSDVRRRTPA